MELCQGMAAELRAGRTAADALDRAVSELAEHVRARFGPAVAAARSGGDVEPALAALGAEPGLGGLTGLAACWRVGAETGTGFAAVLDRLTETLRADIAHRAEVAAQLAGARSSARLLAGLPVVGLALAAGLGTNPLAFLLRTPYGLACLAAGVALDTLGLLWTRRLATNAEERS
ncbi:MAG TPA: type II secretion system F family protein [Streptosporangiaceae bacterium]